MDSKEYRIPESLLTDLCNDMLVLETMVEHALRLDWLERTNIALAAEHLKAFMALVNEQHPVEDVVLRVEVAR